MPKKECLKPGCERPAKKKGVCLEHFEENYVGACTLDGCEEVIYAQGRCKAHYMRLLRHKNGDHKVRSLDSPVRHHGSAMLDVFTRIPQETADVLVRESGRKDGLYKKMQEILIEWAQQHQPA